jgi:hypothetical protein
MRWFPFAAGAAAAALLFFGCAEGPRTGGPASAPTDIDPAEERLGKEEAAARGTGAPARMAPADVDSEQASKALLFDPSLLPAAARERLRGVPVPVLLPAADAVGAPDAYGSATASRGERWYSVSLSVDGVGLSVFGTGQAAERPELQAVVPPAGDAPRVSRTHGIVQATFRRFGVAYSIDVECAAPRTDPRCTGDAYVLGLVNAMRRLEVR